MREKTEEGGANDVNKNMREKQRTQHDTRRMEQKDQGNRETLGNGQEQKNRETSRTPGEQQSQEKSKGESKGESKGKAKPSPSS
jgi:hypothetical protein